MIVHFSSHMSHFEIPTVVQGEVSGHNELLFYTFFSLVLDNYNSFSDFQLIFRQPIRYINIFILFSDFSIRLYRVTCNLLQDVTGIQVLLIISKMLGCRSEILVRCE